MEAKNINEARLHSVDSSLGAGIRIASTLVILLAAMLDPATMMTAIIGTALAGAVGYYAAYHLDLNEVKP